ncbi:MAG: hypothetical protein JOZ73_08505, partial [Solirubrobacterales bacterium]|nr:hypothetical protein [Solirubrobacterales bacterium]
MSKKSLRWLALVVALLGLAAGTALAAGGNSIKIKTPKRVKVGHQFKIVTSGYATAPANEIIGVDDSLPCKATWIDEYNLLGQPATVPLARIVHGKFK